MFLTARQVHGDALGLKPSWEGKSVGQLSHLNLSQQLNPML